MHKCLWDNKDKISKACQKEERKIQIMQSSNTELMPNLAKACKAERAAHCKSVRPGKSRLYNCLISNSDSVSFHPRCNFFDQYFCRQKLTSPGLQRWLLSAAKSGRLKTFLKRQLVQGGQD